MNKKLNKNEFRTELIRYVDFLEDTRSEMCYKFITPVYKILKDEKLKDDEQLNLIRELTVHFHKCMMDWKFESKSFGR